MKITTKTGDNGKTGLFGGRRVRKNSPFIEMVGALDELQSFLGICKLSVGKDVFTVIERIQKDLYRMMSVCGFEFKVPSNISEICADDVAFLDGIMEQHQKLVADLSKFTLPGGSEASAKLDYARTICRRVERVFVGMNEQVPTDILVYLNRLSDVLFVLGNSLRQNA